MRKNEILLVVPTYQCEGQIIRTLEQMDQRLIGRIAQLLVVDNHGNDATATKAAQFFKERGWDNWAKVYRNGSNLGLGGTFKSVLEYGRRNGHSHFIFLHGDAQARSEESHLFLDVLERNPHLDAILGARFMKGSCLIGYSKVREWGNRIINWVTSALTLKRIHDIGSGLNLYRIGSLEEKDVQNLPNHIAFDMHLLLHFIERQMNIEFLPITWVEEDQVSTVRNFEVGVQVLRILLQWRIGWRGKQSGTRHHDGLHIPNWEEVLP